MTLKPLKEWIEFQKLKLEVYFEDNSILEMGNMQPKETGLHRTVHIMFAAPSVKHGPRVKVSNVHLGFSHEDNFTVTAEHEPKVIGKCKLPKEHLDNIIDWVKLNHKHIHHIWHHGSEMSSVDASKGFKKF